MAGGFWDFFGIGNSAERRALRAQSAILEDLASQQDLQAALQERNIAEEEMLGREAAGRHREVANINAGNAAAREAEMTAAAQQNAAQRALGVRGGSGAGALAGMKAGLQAREGAMAGAFARQQGRQDAARQQLETSQRATRGAISQQQNAAMQSRQAAAQNRIGSQQALSGISSGAARAGQLFGNVAQLILSDENYKDFHKTKPPLPAGAENRLNTKVMKLLGVRDGGKSSAVN